MDPTQDKVFSRHAYGVAFQNHAKQVAWSNQTEMARLGTPLKNLFPNGSKPQCSNHPLQPVTCQHKLTQPHQSSKQAKGKIDPNKLVYNNIAQLLRKCAMHGMYVCMYRQAE